MHPKLLYIHPQSSTFIRKDIGFLSKHYQVSEHGFLMENKVLLPLMFVRQLLFLLIQLHKAEQVLVMFGGYHALLPTLLCRIMGKPCYIILGGTDCTSYLSIGYGTFRKPIQAKVTAYGYRMCSGFLPVHRSLLLYRNEYYPDDGAVQGCKAFVPNLRKPFLEIYNGFEPTNWYVGKKQEASFVTVGLFDTRDRLKLKGVDLIVEMAKAYPQCVFTIIGVGREGLLPRLPNLKTMGRVTHDELRELFATQRFYLQLSISEGFPNAICEAMLSGCIPIGSNVTSIPEIIGDTGLVLEKRDSELLNRLMTQALELPDKDAMGTRARERIKERYPVEARQDKMLHVLRDGLPPPPHR